MICQNCRTQIPQGADRCPFCHVSCSWTPQPPQPQPPQRHKSSRGLLVTLIVLMSLLAAVLAAVVVVLVISHRGTDTETAPAAVQEGAIISDTAGETEETSAPDPEAAMEETYAQAEDLVANGEFEAAAELFRQLEDYKDSLERLDECERRMSADLSATQIAQMDEWLRQTLTDTFNGPTWSSDTLVDMEYLGCYTLVLTDTQAGLADNYIYLLYKVTASNPDAEVTYYWFGQYTDVDAQDGESLSAAYLDTGFCFTNGAGEEYRVPGSSVWSGSYYRYYYYGYETAVGFEDDWITPYLTDYSCVWTPAD